MKIKTLKKLIENAAKTAANVQEFQITVLTLIELYEVDKEPDIRIRGMYSETADTHNQHLGDVNPYTVTYNVKKVSTDNGIYSGNWTTSTTNKNGEEKDS